MKKIVILFFVAVSSCLWIQESIASQATRPPLTFKKQLNLLIDDYEKWVRSNNDVSAFGKEIEVLNNLLSGSEANTCFRQIMLSNDSCKKVISVFLDKYFFYESAAMFQVQNTDRMINVVLVDLRKLDAMISKTNPSTPLFQKRIKAREIFEKMMNYYTDYQKVHSSDLQRPKVLKALTLDDFFVFTTWDEDLNWVDKKWKLIGNNVKNRINIINRFNRDLKTGVHRVQFIQFALKSVLENTRKIYNYAETARPVLMNQVTQARAQAAQYTE